MNNKPQDFAYLLTTNTLKFSILDTYYKISKDHHGYNNALNILRASETAGQFKEGFERQVGALSMFKTSDIFMPPAGQPMRSSSTTGSNTVMAVDDDDGITFILDGKPFKILSTQKGYNQVVEMLEEKRPNESEFKKFLESAVWQPNPLVWVDIKLKELTLKMLDGDQDVLPMMAFLERCIQNLPSVSIPKIIEFYEEGKLTFSPEGLVLGDPVEPNNTVILNAVKAEDLLVLPEDGIFNQQHVRAMYSYNTSTKSINAMVSIQDTSQPEFRF